jgi:hypothetical protein
MLLVLYREYVQRRNGAQPTFTYREWLDCLTDDAADYEVTLGDVIRSGIDPTYQGM